MKLTFSIRGGASLRAGQAADHRLEDGMREVIRFWLISSLTIVLGIVPAARAAEPTDMKRIQAADQAVREKLRREIKLDVIETPFNDVLMDLKKTLDVTIVLDPEGLSEADVTPDQLITLNLQDKRGDAILRVLLEPLHLECGVRDGLVIITSREKYEESFLSVRVFDVRALVESAATPSKSLPRWTKSPKSSTRGLAAQTAGGGHGGIGLPPGTSRPPAAGGWATAEPAPAFEPETPADHFVALVCDSVAPDTWTHRGGHATAKVFGGVLVVRQTEEALAEIADLVEQMRRATAVEDPLR
jgi:hypothetical protein